MEARPAVLGLHRSLRGSTASPSPPPSSASKTTPRSPSPSSSAPKPSPSPLSPTHTTPSSSTPWPRFANSTCMVTHRRNGPKPPHPNPLYFPNPNSPPHLCRPHAPSRTRLPRHDAFS
ncbi:hypothetical protein GYH30_029923 [Glycine max]|uniref:Uncharacterized protein n=1 Tax=Glycine max TaxID=3847 RepID=A0A0R0HKU8_SOYBN|nr:hypothetical protein GYH30_029923 [Glycine max]